MRPPVTENSRITVLYPPASTEERAAATSRTAIVGALTNLVLSGLKVGAGLVGQSQALIADAIHSLSDLLSDVLVLLAGKHAVRGPDPDHPYGHRLYETVATLVLAFLQMVVALGIG